MRQRARPPSARETTADVPARKLVTRSCEYHSYHGSLVKHDCSPPPERALFESAGAVQNKPDVGRRADAIATAERGSRWLQLCDQLQGALTPDDLGEPAWPGDYGDAVPNYPKGAEASGMPRPTPANKPADTQESR